MTVSCTPRSNEDVFKVGVTPVTCTATDDDGNHAERSFTITVELRTYEQNSNPDPGQGERPTPRAG